MNDNIIPMREEFEKKRQEEREEMTKTVDLMKEIIFQLDNRNRDLMDVMKEMDISNREFKTRIREEIDQRTKENFG